MSLDLFEVVLEVERSFDIAIYEGDLVVISYQRTPADFTVGEFDELVRRLCIQQKQTCAPR